MANNTTTSTCANSPSFDVAASLVNFLAYTALPPVYFLFGAPAHVLALVSFLRPSQTEKAYGYQVLVTSTKVVHICTYAWFYILRYNVAGKVLWFSQSFWLMWYTTHVAYFFESCFLTIPIAAAAAMAVDRAYALYDPSKHETLPHKKNLIVASLVSIALGFCIGIDLSFVYVVVEDKSTGYQITRNPIFVGNLISFKLNACRNAARMLILIVLISSSVLMIYFYIKQKKIIQAVVGGTNTLQHKERKSIKKKLIVLALFQSISIGVTTIGWCVFNVGYVLSPTTFACQGLFVSDLIDCWLQVVNTLDLYVFFITNRRFRQMIMNVVRRNPVVTTTAMY